MSNLCRDSIGPLNENPPHYSQPGSEALIILQDITTPISGGLKRFIVELVGISKAKYANSRDRSIYEGSIDYSLQRFA
ncbi:hypothetical protein PUN28_017752 [Cardiocondyla obscurior]|uniref:Uncharacterized protein n=1 Tax=Cardiocondyla obscurior TaxID=286306 RepID=A0AAW2EIZ5_9HYME